MSRIISNTTELMAFDWPEDCYLQGGTGGVVFTKTGSYRTAFVEAFPEGTFLRGEGKSISEAEEACWKQYQAFISCSHGPYEARNHTNGSGFCVQCGTWFPKSVCGLPELKDDPLAGGIIGDLETMTESLDMDEVNAKIADVLSELGANHHNQS